ncbi:MAG: undecaprenyl diphosphate synthase [Candidatus Woesearchaeota archaeon]|jgi:undecaprenyl diphosphate synthase
MIRHMAIQAQDLHSIINSNQEIEKWVRIAKSANVRLLTILLPSGDVLEKMLEVLSKKTYFIEENIKCSVIGNWFDLSETCIAAIKRITHLTSGCTSMQVTFAVNYDAKEELVRATQEIAIRTKHSKIKPEDITQTIIKTHLPTESLMYVTHHIISGSESTHGFLLWDAMDAKIMFVKQAYLITAYIQDLLKNQ